MKKFIIFLLALVAATGSSFGQKLIAVQNENNASFYRTVDEAIENAVSGDYLYLPGGSFTISKPINKTLHIYGVGHNPDSCAATGITHLSGEINISGESDYGSLNGLLISGNINFMTDLSEIDNKYFAIERCNIQGSIGFNAHSSEILINECIITGGLDGAVCKAFKCQGAFCNLIICKIFIQIVIFKIIFF